MDEARLLSTLVDKVSELSASVAGLAAEVRGISGRLDKINGSVGRHDKCLTEIRLNCARSHAESATFRDVFSGMTAIAKAVMTVVAAAVAILSGAGASKIVKSLLE
jgi:phage-related minor tail protein